MDTFTSDFIISISAIIGALIAKILPKRIKLIWRITIALVAAIIISTLAHIIVKLCGQKL